MDDRNTSFLVNVETEFQENEVMILGQKLIDADEKVWRVNISSSEIKQDRLCNWNSCYIIRHERNEINSMDKIKMPGFRIIWKYNKDLEPDSNFINLPKSVEFVR